MTMERFLLFELAFNVVVLIVLAVLLREKPAQEKSAPFSGTVAATGDPAIPPATATSATKKRRRPLRAIGRLFRRGAKSEARRLDDLVAALENKEGAAERELRVRLAAFRERAHEGVEMAG